MFGNILDLIYKVVKECDSPIGKDIGEKTPTQLHTAIYTEFWKEVIKRKQFSPYTTIELPKLGVFDISMSPLKKFLHSSIIELRKMKPRVKRLKQQKNIVVEEHKLYLAYTDLQNKVRIAWQQLEILRKVIIIRTIAWNQKLREKGESHRIIIDYKPTDYTFVEYFIEHKKLPPIDF